MKNRCYLVVLVLIAVTISACVITPLLDFNPGKSDPATPRQDPTPGKPDAPTPQQYYDRGMSDLGTGADGRDLEGALENFTNAIMADPTFVKAWNALGVTNVLLEKYADAAQDFENALIINPSYAPARENLQHLKAGEYDQAVTVEY
jgi:tetratricopeptide (TPR) repeat protein